MKPGLNRTVYVLQFKKIVKTKVCYVGVNSFLTENSLNVNMPYYYNDYNERWFTSLYKAKSKLLNKYKSVYPNSIVVQVGENRWQIIGGKL